MNNLSNFLDSSDDPFWKQTLSVGGGMALGVIATRSIDNFAANRLHPLALFALKAALGFGVGTVAANAGYDRLANGLVFGALADTTITYANQIQYRYLPGAASAPALP